MSEGVNLSGYVECVSPEVERPVFERAIVAAEYLREFIEIRTLVACLGLVKVEVKFCFECFVCAVHFDVLLRYILSWFGY